MNRRTWLAALLGAVSTAALGASGAGARPPQRIVVLDWALTEMLLSIGVAPVGAANTTGFRRNFPASDLPAAVVDLGLMFQPNLELMRSLNPDLIVISPAHAALRASLERLAPTVTFGQYRSSPTPYTAARNETLQLARMLACTPRAQVMLANADRSLDDARIHLAARHGARNIALYVVRFLDETHLRVYGSQSLFGEMLTTLGLQNAWQGAPRAGGYSTIPFEALEPAPGTALLYLQPLPLPVVNMMKTSPLWAAMPFARAGHMIGVPGVPPEGGVPSAVYFANLLVDALTQTSARSSLTSTVSSLPGNARDDAMEDLA